MKNGTHLFINVEDVNCNQVLGTVFFYKSLDGRELLESAVRVISNVNDCYLKIPAEPKNEVQKEGLRNLYTMLQKYCSVSKPDLAIALRKKIERSLGIGTVNLLLNEYVEEEIIRNNVYDSEFIREYDRGKIVDPTTILRKAYSANYRNFYEQWNDETKLMVINIKLKNSIDSSDAQLLDKLKIKEAKFGFGELDSEYWHATTLEEFANVAGNYLDDEFIESYKADLRSDGISLMTPKELNLRSGKIIRAVVFYAGSHLEANFIDAKDIETIRQIIKCDSITNPKEEIRKIGKKEYTVIYDGFKSFENSIATPSMVCSVSKTIAYGNLIVCNQGKEPSKSYESLTMEDVENIKNHMSVQMIKELNNSHLFPVLRLN